MFLVWSGNLTLQRNYCLPFASLLCFSGVQRGQSLFCCYYFTLVWLYRTFCRIHLFLCLHSLFLCAISGSVITCLTECKRLIRGQMAIRVTLEVLKVAEEITSSTCNIIKLHISPDCSWHDGCPADLSFNVKALCWLCLLGQTDTWSFGSTTLLMIVVSRQHLLSKLFGFKSDRHIKGLLLVFYYASMSGHRPKMVKIE